MTGTDLNELRIQAQDELTPAAIKLKTALIEFTESYVKQKTTDDQLNRWIVLKRAGQLGAIKDDLLEHRQFCDSLREALQVLSSAYEEKISFKPGSVEL